MTKYTKEQTERARELLTKLCPKGTTVYTTCSKVSANGMSRHIKAYVVNEGYIWNITHLTAHLIDSRLNKDGDAMVVGGCGMNMGFAVVYSLSSALFPNGFRTTKKTRTRNGAKIGTKDSDGGYALKQQWL